MQFNRPGESRGYSGRSGLWAGVVENLPSLAKVKNGLRELARSKAKAPVELRASSEARKNSGAVLYELLKREQAAIAEFQRHSKTKFGERVERLIEIDSRVEEHVAALIRIEAEEHWQGNPGIRVAFGRRLAQTATKLASVYRDLLDEGRRKYPSGSRGASRLPMLACRAITHIGRSMKWHAYAGLTEPQASWGRLYRLYRFAEKRRLLQDAVVIDEASTTTCHKEFTRALLFGLAEPTTFSPAMIDVTYEWCGEWAELIEYQRAAEADGERHCFDMDASAAPCQFHVQMRADRIRCFSTASMCFKLVSLRDINKYAQNSEAVHRHASRLSTWTRDDLIRLLLASWVKARPARRSARESDGLKVARLACGVDAITELLHAESRPEEGIPPELAFEHWAVENESNRGYGLARKKLCADPEAGSLVCVRANGSPVWQLGVVRWERDGDSTEPRMGIETLADNPQSVKLFRSGDDADAPFNALLLSKRTVTGTNERSLVLSASAANIGEAFRITPDKADAAAAFMIRLTATVDETDSWKRMSFSVLRRA